MVSQAQRVGRGVEGAAMKTLCKHDNYKVIDNIWEPKYSTREVLINKDKVGDTEHYLIKFQKAPSLPDWYYLNRRDIVKRRTQRNGAGTMYCVPLNLLDDFKPVKTCEHAD